MVLISVTITVFSGTFGDVTHLTMAGVIHSGERKEQQHEKTDTKTRSPHSLERSLRPALEIMEKSTNECIEY